MEYFGHDVHTRSHGLRARESGGILLGQGRIANDPGSRAAKLAPSVGAAKVVLEAGGIWPGLR